MSEPFNEFQAIQDAIAGGEGDEAGEGADGAGGAGSNAAADGVRGDEARGSDQPKDAPNDGAASAKGIPDPSKPAGEPGAAGGDDGAEGADDLGGTPPAPGGDAEASTAKLFSDAFVRVRDLEQRSAELERELKERDAKLSKAMNLDEFAKNPARYLKQHGIEWNDFLKAAAAEAERGDSGREISEVASALKETKSELVKLRELRIVQKIITGEPDKARWGRLLRYPEYDEAVLAQFYEDWQTTGRKPSPEAVADKLEALLEERETYQEFLKSRKAPAKTEAPQKTVPDTSKTVPPPSLPGKNREAAAATEDPWALLEKRLGREPREREVTRYVVYGELPDE